MERFWSKVNKTDGCWLWTAAICKSNGYGKFGFNGKTPDAHRFAWQLVHGEIPDGLHVLHTCDVKLCVNPDHLYLGTHRDNMRDARLRHRYPSGDRHYARKNPEHCWRSKLTWEIVAKIREERASGASAYVLAERYNVTPSNIWAIVRGRIWKTHKEATA